MEGDLADVLQPGREPFTAIIGEMYNQDWQRIQTAPHAEMLVYWKTEMPVEPGAYLRVRNRAEQ